MVDDLNVGSRVQSKLIKGLAAVEPVGLAIIVNTQHVHKLWMRVLIARWDVEHLSASTRRRRQLKPADEKPSARKW